MASVKKNGHRRRGLGLAVLVAVTSATQSAAAREVWDCAYEGVGDDPAHYVTRFEKRATTLVEPRWPNPISYRIFEDTRERLVAVHVYAEPASFRRDARAGAIVLIIDKRTGRLHRSATKLGDSVDEVLEGHCEMR